MIINDISTFLTTKNQDDRHIVLSMLLKQSLEKTRKYEVTISFVVEPEMYFFGKPMDLFRSPIFYYIEFININPTQ